MLGQIQVPTTIIWGMIDGIFPLTCATDLHQGIAGSKLILRPRVGHMAQVQTSLTVAYIIQRAASPDDGC